jgi:hypothetical protein
VPCQLVIEEGAPHTFKLHDEHRDYRAAVTEFFQKYLGS